MNLEERLRQPLLTGEPLSIEEVAHLVPRPRTRVVRLEAAADVRRHQWGSRALLAAAAACLVAVCYALVGTSSPAGDVETSPASGATTTSIDPMAMADAYMALGWVNSGMGPLLPGVERPASMWLRFYDDDVIDPLHFDDENKAPTFDAPNGSLIGYTFEHLGFVPLSVYEDPAFDPVAALRQVWGCAPEVDPGCTEKPPAARD